MVFDFEGRLHDTPTIESAMSWRERVLLSLFIHVLAVLMLLFVPRLPFVQAAAERRVQRIAELSAEQQGRQVETAADLAASLDTMDEPTFVFVQPRVDTPAPAPPESGAPSDIDRVSQSPELAENPVNDLPNADGNTFEFVVAEEIGDTIQPAGALADADGLEPEPVNGLDTGIEDGAEDAAAEASEGQDTIDAAGAEGPESPGEPAAEAARVAALDPPRNPDALTNPFPRDPVGPSPDGGAADGTPGSEGGRAPTSAERAASLLRQAMRPDSRLTQSRSFHNFGGRANNMGPDIQFDTKGVEFGPWIRRFVAQVYRNWFVPYAAMSMSGHVVLTFNVHRDGSLTDLIVQRRSSVDAFTNSAFNALRQSNPTVPLPEEYPDDQAFFTVTFYFNERPAGR